MGGKGGGNDQPMQQAEPEIQTEGGWKWADSGTRETPKPPEKPKTPEKKLEPVTEAPGGKPPWETPLPFTGGVPGYAAANTNLSPLGDALVGGLAAEPGKAGPRMPQQYAGQV